MLSMVQGHLYQIAMVLLMGQLEPFVALENFRESSAVDVKECVNIRGCMQSNVS